jgi:hypothetical protein
MAILENVLEPAYRAGEMSVKQEECYQELKAKLTETAPDLAKRLELFVTTCVLKE